jgi:hypothetical protein
MYLLYDESNKEPSMSDKEKHDRQPQDKFVLRFDGAGDQRTKLKVRAAENRRTMNAEILYLIEKGIEAVEAGRNAVQ